MVVSFQDTNDDVSSNGIPFTTLSNVEMAYPCSLADVRNEDKNEWLYEELVSSHLYLKAVVTSSVLVKGKKGREEKKRMNKEVNILKCGLTFCVTLIQVPSQASFWRVSLYSLRLVYTMALAFRRLLIQYEEVRVKRAQRVGKPDLVRQTSNLYKTWASLCLAVPCQTKVCVTVSWS
jgi:hypothetical protein